MLIDRLRTSAILIAIASGLLYLDAHFPSWPGADGLWLLPLLLFFSLGTAWDMAGLLATSSRAIDRSVTLVVTALITLSSAVPLVWAIGGAAYPADCPVGRLGWIAIAAVAGIFVVLLREMLRFRGHPSRVIERAVAGVFVSHYVGLPMALLFALRGIGDSRWGLAALVTTIVVTKSADAGAYFVGKLVGRHKLIPWLSPGKTWEGAIGGILVSTLVAAACLGWGFPWVLSSSADGMKQGSLVSAGSPSLIWAIVLGPVLAMAGMMGDLAESLIKRSAGVKDSGSWLPGLGGVWDVTDSLIAAVMPAFLCFAAAA